MTNEPLDGVGEYGAFVSMLHRAGVDYVLGRPSLGTITVDVTSYGGPQNKGYSGFYATFTFQADTGVLLDVGIWE